MRCSQVAAQVFVGLVTAVLLAAGCSSGGSTGSGASSPSGRNERKATSAQEEKAMALDVSSTAFEDGSGIPRKYTCDGEDLSPPLSWEGSPDGMASFSLIADDPDAPRGTFVHWVLYDIPPDVTALPEGVASSPNTAFGAIQGRNDFGRQGYGGPCPPSGSPHRYFFKLYALDAQLGLGPGATKQDVLNAVEGHIVAEGQLVGTYQRE